MIELKAWPLDNKQYTSVDLGAAYAARSRGLLTAESFALTTNGDNTVTLAKGLGSLHVSEFWACFPYSENDIILQFEDADGVYPRKDVIVLGYDKNANQTGIYVRAGLAAENPEMPAIRRDSDYDEIYLYCVTRPTGATSITADNVVDLRLDAAYCGLMRDTIDAIDTSVMQAAFEAFLAQIEQELDQLNAGTATMLKSTYDPQGKSKDIFKSIDAAAAKYEATLTLDGWVTSSGEEQSAGYPYAQEVTLTALTPGAPTVMESSEFLSPCSRNPVGVPETDAVLDEAMAIINSQGVTSSLDGGKIRTIIQEKPTADVTLQWLIRTEVS
ncbi:hypothetical protein [Subdoligranulum variabile]|uniref:Uncharacterized protein n=1 Tax=Subdoligranulum variabile DSM 15176 TaxID=411471 RepID=D1PRF1_9FIRM|nr:hypothetical protein [Subdoligranulum variabile]EFB74677.1 hypothetical protein SUBVAR_06980 [Subdoligranulum variabile DSM 15176]UWP69417.1 hypothetical protein NQ490_06095 [Subdoligranulum variabile]